MNNLKFTNMVQNIILYESSRCPNHMYGRTM